MAHGLVKRGAIEKMEADLKKAIKYFSGAVQVATLRRTKATGEHSSLATAHSQLLHVDEALLMGRLKFVETNHRLDLRCANGTRGSLLERVIQWVSTERRQKEKSGTYWIYGLPGIGKTSLAHSICGMLHDKWQLAGAFFCQRGNETLSDHKNILPTLILKLAGTFPLFRSTLVERVRDDPHLTPGAMKLTLLLEVIRELPYPPKRPLVFVIDELDACGGTRSLTNGRTEVLKALTDAAADTPWLKIIIISRPDRDILKFFDEPIRPPHDRYDLTKDEEDLQTFTQDRFNWVVSELFPTPPWPEQSLIEEVISRAEGLFIFIDTIAHGIVESQDAKRLKPMLEDPSRPGWKPLYQRYSSILEEEIRYRKNFREVIGVLLIVPPSCTLREETLATLAGVEHSRVKAWVAGLSSLLYRDTNADGTIRVRHSSVSDYLTNACHEHYRPDLQAARVLLAEHFKTSGEGYVPGGHDTECDSEVTKVSRHFHFSSSHLGLCMSKSSLKN